MTKQESPPAWTQEAYRPQEGARCWPPPPAGPDPPPLSADWPDPPPRLTDLTPPRQLALTPPWLAGPDTPPPRCGQTNKVKLLPSRRTMYAGSSYFYPPWRQGKVNIWSKGLKSSGLRVWREIQCLRNVQILEQSVLNESDVYRPHPKNRWRY